MKLSKFFKRYQEKISLYSCFKGGLKGIITILLLSVLSRWKDVTLLAAPFGASCILLYTTPHDEFAQPINIIGGYFVAGVVSLIFLQLCPQTWLTVGLLVGVTTTIIAIFRVTHPPAGAIPIVAFPALSFLFFPVISGSSFLVLTTFILHRTSPQCECLIK